MTVRLYLVQRVTALLMAPLMLAHLVVIFVATSDGLSAGEVLARTTGSPGWAAFYGMFVLLAAAHGAIGLRVVAAEWAGIRGLALDAVMWGFGLGLSLLGLRAVVAVVLPGAFDGAIG